MNRNLKISGGLICAGNILVSSRNTSGIPDRNILCPTDINGNLYINGNLTLIGKDICAYSEKQDMSLPIQDTYIDGDTILIFDKISVKDNVTGFHKGLKQMFRREKINNIVNNIKNKNI